MVALADAASRQRSEDTDVNSTSLEALSRYGRLLPCQIKLNKIKGPNHAEKNGHNVSPSVSPQSSTSSAFPWLMQLLCGILRRHTSLEMRFFSRPYQAVSRYHDRVIAVAKKKERFQIRLIPW